MGTKVEILSSDNPNKLQDAVNNFIYNKEIIDIKTCVNGEYIVVTVIYMDRRK